MLGNLLEFTHLAKCQNKARQDLNLGPFVFKGQTLPTISHGLKNILNLANLFSEE